MASPWQPVLFPDHFHAQTLAPNCITSNWERQTTQNKAETSAEVINANWTHSIRPPAVWPAEVNTRWYKSSNWSIRSPRVEINWFNTTLVILQERLIHSHVCTANMKRDGSWLVELKDRKQGEAAYLLRRKYTNIRRLTDICLCVQIKQMELNMSVSVRCPQDYLCVPVFKLITCWLYSFIIKGQTWKWYLLI